MLPMSVVTMRQHNQDSSGVLRAAKNEPVFLTSRGKTTHVLMSIEHFEKISGGQKSIADMLGQPGGPEYDFDFEPPKIGQEFPRPAEFD
jgi:prevent-host-death family protein